MKCGIILVTALGRMPKYNRAQCAAAAHECCKQFEGKNYIVLTDFPRYCIDADFCGLPVEVIPAVQKHTHDHRRYYGNLWWKRPIWAVCAVGSIFEYSHWAAQQALTALCGQNPSTCQLHMYE